MASSLRWTLGSVDIIWHQNNILVDEKGHAILVDFGRSKVVGEVGYSTALLAGSAAYMAPELFPTGEVNIDELFSKESDIYAFAMVCIMVSLKYPQREIRLMAFSRYWQVKLRSRTIRPIKSSLLSSKDGGQWPPVK
jgi:serine/threonine protein kinase